MNSKYRVTYYVSIVFLFLSLSSSAQSLIGVSGSTIENSSLVVEYAVGEVAITTLADAKYNLTQGLLQPNLKISNPSCEIINYELLSFENPTRDKIRLVGRFDWITDYQIFATDGKLIRQAKFSNNYIDVSNLPSALYFIRLFPGCNENYRVLKIVKQ